jgi:hypothetical protein
MPVVVQTPPTLEPLTLYEAKRHLKMDDYSDDDAHIQDWIRAARMTIEAHYNLALLPQTLQLVLDGFFQPTAERATWLPATGTWLGTWGSVGVWGSGLVNAWSVLELTPPLQSITSVQYLDPSSILQTMPTANYGIDKSTFPGRLYPTIGHTWPITAPLPGAVQITFAAGYQSQASVPDDIKAAIRLLLGHFYANREQVVMSIGRAGKAIDLPRGVDQLMGAYWRPLVL